MSNYQKDDIKTGLFNTCEWSEPKCAAAVKTVQVMVDHKAATRQAIIVELRRERFQFKTRSEWKAKASSGREESDWAYHGIALHHAGNSASCDADSAAQLRGIEVKHAKFGHIGYHYAIGCDGVIYEALDIRNKGAHIDQGNTGVIGIVMLADLSVGGESGREKYADKSFWKRFGGSFEMMADNLDTNNDKPTEIQTEALLALVKALNHRFNITSLGGHREYQRLATKEGRACPGRYGMMLVDMLRDKLKLSKPK